MRKNISAKNLEHGLACRKNTVHVSYYCNCHEGTKHASTRNNGGSCFKWVEKGSPFTRADMKQRDADLGESNRYFLGSEIIYANTRRKDKLVGFQELNRGQCGKGSNTG